jgi:branched-chain amino acid transport system permease protein
MITEQILNGIVLGSMYALVAIGYTLVFGVLGKLNFAHAEIFMFGGFVGLSWLALGAPVWLSIVAAFLIAGMLGLVVEILSFRKFTGPDAHITAALSSLAVGLVLIDLTQKTWGTEPLALPLPDAFRISGFEIAGIRVVWVKAAILFLTFFLMALLHLVVSRTAMGRNIRAVAYSPTSAALLGINVKRVNQQTFFIASALAGVAGLTLALRTGFVTSEIGFTFGIKALAIMAIGGMGDLRGAMLGGLLVGLVEALAFQFGFGRLADIAVWILMIVILLARPAGLFGSATSEESGA